MKARAWLLTLLLLLIPFSGIGQACYSLDEISIFQKDRSCSPVQVVSWEVGYTEVNTGSVISIRIDWDDGIIEIWPTIQNPVGTYKTIATHQYVSIDEKCNYNPVANLVVDGVTCTSSPVRVGVTVWDVDNKNGAYVNASPNVFPVCIGNSATMRFDDDTKYNCVPPQEEDNPNETTRWIQWVYGTSNDMTTGTPVSVDGYTGPWPYTTPVKTLPGPSWGSGERSLPIFVDDDKLIGQEFEVELRYWNYCNKYTDGAAPVIDRSVIRIVGLPDATIDPVAPLCEFEGNVILTAATGGGTWSGPGIIDGAAGTFSPSTAGPGTHQIHYQVTDGNSCSAEDDISIEVIDAPDGTITPVDPICLGDAPFNMVAATSPGTWNSSAGITNSITGTFSPAVAGIGSHEVTYKTETDASGCFGTDTSIVHVVAPPFAAFLTPDSAWCQEASNSSTASIILTGLDTTTFDLEYEAGGISYTLVGQSAGTFDLPLDNLPGDNLYILKKVTEYHGANSCETPLDDTLHMNVHIIPEATISIGNVGYCSPVEVSFEAAEGFSTYSWDFGDGDSDVSSNNQSSHTYTYSYTDNLIVVDGDSIFDLSRHDTVYKLTLHAETAFGCKNDSEDSIRIYPNPKADFFVAPLLQNHPDSVVILYNLTSAGPWDYSWDFGDADYSELEEPVEHIYDTWGFFDISLRSFSDFCADTITKRIQIMPPAPRAEFFPDTFGCPPLSVQFTNTSLYADTYIWDFDDGKFSSEPNPTHIFFDNREHKVSMAAYGLSGSDTANHKVFVYTPPQGIFEAYPKESRNLKQTFKFTNNTINGAYYLWDFGDGHTSAEEEPSHIYADSGIYTVTLYSWSIENCVDTVIHENLITVRAGEGSADFPTAFAWNGSGPTGGHWSEGVIDNTVFHPAVVNAKTFRMVIYTRWGEQIFESNDLYIGWDGYIKGAQLANEGVYLWKAWIKYVDGAEEIKVGDITFLH